LPMPITASRLSFRMLTRFPPPGVKGVVGPAQGAGIVGSRSWIVGDIVEFSSHAQDLFITDGIGLAAKGEKLFENHVQVHHAHNTLLGANLEIGHPFGAWRTASPW
jgi:hypothetical protein